MGDMEIAIGGLKDGISIEDEGIVFYTRAGEGLTDPNGRNTLVFLAEEEKRHKALFEGMLSDFEGEEGVEDAVAARIEGFIKPRIFPERIEFSGVTSGDNDVIREAKGVEERSIDFYGGLREKVEGEVYKKLFSALVDAETEHLRWLEYMNDSLNLYGYWSSLQEYFANE